MEKLRDLQRSCVICVCLMATVWLALEGAAFEPLLTLLLAIDALIDKYGRGEK